MGPPTSPLAPLATSHRACVSRGKLSVLVKPVKCFSLASAGFGWATAVPSPELLQHPPGTPSPASPNSEQGGLRHSEDRVGQAVEVGRGCPRGSHLKINAFPGCKQRFPLRGWGSCFQALAEHEHHCCPPDSLGSSSFGGSSLARTGLAEESSVPPPTTAPQSQAPLLRAREPHCIPRCRCLGSSRSSAASKNHPAESKTAGNMDAHCTAVFYWEKKEAKRAAVRSAGRASPWHTRPLSATRFGFTAMPGHRRGAAATVPPGRQRSPRRAKTRRFNYLL